jgi:thioredoxin-like negative regulator of GroEL/predicted regulator of Ras-like GTPase activity (Roadblock/LC7/MglB family)
MALFNVVGKQLRRLRKRAHEQPSPTTMAELAETCFKLGLPEEAFRTLERGMAMYPDSELLHNLAAHLRRAEFERQARVLQRLVGENPNDPAAYLALAEIFFAVRDTNKVLEVVTEGLAHCPGEAALLLLAARVRLERCSRDLSERDCILAVEDLRQVLQENPDNHEVRRLLGQVFYLLGHHRAAVELLEPYVQYNPWDEHAQGWLTAAQAGPGPAESLVLEQAVTRAFTRGHFSIELGGEREHPLVESLTERPMTRDLVLGSTERLKQALLIGEGLRAAVWAGLEGPQVLIRGEGLGEADVLALAGVAAAGERACLDMDLGRPERAVITGPAGTVVMVGFANGHLLAFFSPALRSRDAERRVNAALQEAGVLAEETTRA